MEQGYGRLDKSSCPNPIYEFSVTRVMFRDIQLVIYDLDGVLIDSNKAIVESFRLLHEEIGEPFNPEDVLSRIGVGLLEIFREILPERHHDNLAALRLSYIRNFQELGTGYIRLLPDVSETLAEMNTRGFSQSVATNKTDYEAERILKALKMDPYIDLYAGYGTVPKIKPEPDMILYTLAKLGVKPENAVFVDDTKIGLTAGIRAGVNTIGITTGNNTLDQIQEVNPTTIIHEFGRLTEIIR
ncbi:MAG: HAD family hydrolase [Candidatus Bathyarchaeota archaeon]